VRRPLVLAVALLAVVAVTAVAPASRAGRSRVCTRGMVTVERDPRRLLRLTGDPIAPAAKAALRYTRPSARPQVTSVELATWDHGRGPEARFECGARAWRRTVVVYVTLRAFLPSASLSEKIFFVGRFKAGSRVWQVVH
jgi:hypothetical protein